MASFDPLDSLTTLTIDDYFNATLDTTNMKEGSGCLKVNNLTDEATVKLLVFDILTTYPDARKVISFWFQMNALNGHTFFRFKVINTTNDHYICIFGNYDSATSKPKLALYVARSGVFVGTAFTVVELDTWYYVEMDWVNTNLQKWWLDGAEKPSLANFAIDIGSAPTVRIEQGAGGNVGRVLVDYARIHTEEEYPPDYLMKKLHPFWRLKP